MNNLLCLYANKTQSGLLLNLEVEFQSLPHNLKYMQFCPSV